MAETGAIGGQPKIYADLLVRLESADIPASAERLGLPVNSLGEAEVPFLGMTFFVSNKGVRRGDGRRFGDAVGSVLAHYILNGSRSRPAGQFVTFSELAGPLFKQASYSQGALERPVTQRFQGRVPELMAAAVLLGGRLGGEGGLGAQSLIFELLPHVELQLIFYDRDDEFPARATLLLDRNATELIEFEVVAVLVTIFVYTLTKGSHE